MGQEEDAVAPVRGADVARAEHEPLRIEPEAGQRPENVAKSCASIDAEEPSDVLEQEPLGSSGSEHALDVGPEPALVGAAESLAGDAIALAWYPGDDEVAGFWLIGGEVAPNRSRSQGALRHARSQDRAGVGFPLHVSDRAHASAQSGEGSLDTEVESTPAGAEGEDAEGR